MRTRGSEQGLTMLDTVLTLVIVALAITIAFPMFNATPQNLAADMQDFTLNLQVARELGISQDEHSRVRVFSSGPPYKYAIENYNGTAWVTERTITLRPNIVFTGPTLGLVAEFDTRGMLVTLTPPTFTLQDSHRGWSKNVTVNAVGMVDHN